MKKSILLIEDDIWLAESFQAALVAHNHEVNAFTSAHEAMHAIDKTPPDLIVADVLLGDHTTFTLFHELQSYADTANIPIVLCTGVDTNTLTQADLQAYGIVAVLNKSTVTPDQLLLHVAENIGEAVRRTQ
jgi:DNA-binding response OmpR family regulator